MIMLIIPIMPSNVLPFICIAPVYYLEHKLKPVRLQPNKYLITRYIKDLIYYPPESATARWVRHLPETADNISHGSMTTFIITWANIQGPKLRPPAR
jgi:hypothetical protein